jgi:hypothetical protein
MAPPIGTLIDTAARRCATMAPPRRYPDHEGAKGVAVFMIVSIAVPNIQREAGPDQPAGVEAG